MSVPKDMIRSLQLSVQLGLTNNLEENKPPQVIEDVCRHSDNDFYMCWLAPDVEDLKDIPDLSNGPFTIFSPTEAAVEELQEILDYNCIFEDDATPRNKFISSVLLHHVVQGKMLYPSDFTDGQLIPTLSGESLEIRTDSTFYTNQLNLDGTLVDNVAVNVYNPEPPNTNANENTVYMVDKVILPNSVLADIPNILSDCEEPRPVRYCKEMRRRFDDFTGTQACASCGGYLNEEGWRGRTEECHWFSDHCTDECCWDTEATRPQLAAPRDSFLDENHSNRNSRVTWAVAPCDSTWTVHAGWHVTTPGGLDFNRSEANRCKVTEYPKAGSTSVFHVQCYGMHTDLTHSNKCANQNMTLAVWMEDGDGTFAQYYVDPFVEEQDPLPITTDQCKKERFIRIMPFWLVPSILIPIAILVFLRCRQLYRGDFATNPRNTAANPESAGPNDDNTAIGSLDENKV